MGKIRRKYCNCWYLFYAQEELGDIVYVDLPEIGKTVKQNDVLAVIESVKSASDVYSPISGKVIEVNENLKKNQK